MSEWEDYEDRLLEQALCTLTKPQKISEKWGEMTAKPSLFSQHHHYAPQTSKVADPNRHRFNHYADKQLQHLVIAEEFDFPKIVEIMNYIFREERIRFTETSCCQRWTELYLLSRQNESEVKEKRMEDKRASSVSVFTDPFSLYNLEEMLDKIDRSKPTQLQGRSPQNIPKEVSGYNIFKNSIRQIDDIEGYNKRRQEMLSALTTAQDPSHIVTDKLMHFSPYYERLNEFEVKQQELTEEKMKEIMSIPIEMENFERQLKIRDLNETNEQWKAKRSKREDQAIQKKTHKYDIEENWDEYESD